MTRLITILTLFLVGACANSPAQQPTRFVLVHGAFQEEGVWQQTAQSLEAEGHSAVLVDIPGLESGELIKLQTYVDTIVGSLDADTKTVLVGHSFGGITTTLAASQAPEAVRQLIYVAAYIPRPGDSLQSLSVEDTESRFTETEFIVSPDYSRASVLASARTMLFCDECDDDGRRTLVDVYRDEPLPPLAEPAEFVLSEISEVARSAIFTTRDNAISYSFQKEMAERANVADIEELDTGHSPHLEDPKALALALIRLAEE